MAKILYDFENIGISLEKLNGTLKSINTLESSISSLSIDVSELSGALNSAKKTTIENINNITEILTDNIKKVQNLCDAYQEYESSKISSDTLLNKEFPTKEIVSSINYKIKYGDTLSSIAKKQNVTVDAIVEANKDKIKNKNLIFSGDTIVIPTANTESIEKQEVKSNKIVEETEEIVVESNKEEVQNISIEKPANVIENVSINYRTSSVDGNRIVAGNSGYTMNEVLEKIKKECESQGIGEYWTDVCAISLWETGNYTSVAFKNNNPGGLTYADGSTRYSFNTLDEGISAFVSNLNKNYISEGRTTLAQISTKYCPPTATEWTKNVNIMKSQIEKSIS